MRREFKSARGLKGFTLIELLVVVAIIALLISILLPSLGKAKKQAQAAACASNLKQVTLALRMYQDEYEGWLPCSPEGSLWSEAAWWVPKKDLWFYKLTPKYCGNEEAFVCPGDPYKPMFDYESEWEDSGEERADTTDLACGYGMNYWLRHAYSEAGVGDYLMNTDRFGPKRPDATILLAEVGPDDSLELAELYQSVDPSTVGRPWRDGGRLLWDDGNRGWYTGPTWLTARHLGKINMATIDGSVKRVSTVEQLREPIRNRYYDCWGFVQGGHPKLDFICYLCRGDTANPSGFPHYTFAEDQLWWWYGKMPGASDQWHMTH